jgi:hypothetical protein
MIARELVSSGLSSLAALSICGSRALTVTAAGATQGTATALATALNVVTTCTEAASGVILPVNDIGDSITVCNATASNVRVYPPVGGAFNGGTANIPFTMAPNSSEEFYQVGTANYTT